MADTKISALPASTTPLAGTEVLPLVQSGVTKKVAVSDLTAGRAVNTGPLTVTNATGGATAANYAVVRGSTADNSNYPAVELQGGTLYQAGRAPKLTLANAGLGVGLYSGYMSSTFTAQYGIYLDSSVGLQLQSSASGAPVTKLSLGTGNDVTLSLGNFIQGTAAKGVNFTANTPAAGMTSQLLNWYEEGTWTPTMTSAAGTTTVNTSSARYTRIGDHVFVVFRIDYTTNGSVGTSDFTIGGLPFTSRSTFSSRGFVTSSNWTGSDYNDGYLTVNASATTITWAGRAVNQSSRTNAILLFCADYFVA